MRRAVVFLLTGMAAAGCSTTPTPAASPSEAGATRSTVPQSGYPTTPPSLGPARELRLPTPSSRSLSNGLSVIYVTKADLPLVRATLITRGGSSDDSADRPGLASFVAEMLDEGAAGRSSLELAESIEQLGATLTTGVGWDAAQTNLSVLRSRLPEALALMADVVIRPDFPDHELERIRQERLTELARARDEARIIAGNAFAQLVFGTGHPYGRFATEESVRDIDREAVVRFHRRFYRPADATLILVGDVDESAHHAVERLFSGWEAGSVPQPVAPAAPGSGPTRIYLIDKPGAPQSEIRIGHPGVARDHPDFYPLTVMNVILGGSFTSRLNDNLRESRGYTYGASSSFSMRRGSGPFTAASAVVTEKTDSAVIEFFRELNRIRDEPVPTDELERAKSYIALGLPATFETTAQIAGRLAELVVYGLPPSFYDSYVQRVMAVTAEDVQRVARDYVRPESSTIVIVGDRAAIEAGLAALPFGKLEVRAVDEFVR